MPAALARSATSLPTAAACAFLSPDAARTVSSSDDAAASVRLVVSSTTCALMCRVERVTTRRGRAAVPCTFLRTRRCRRVREVRRNVAVLGALMLLGSPRNCERSEQFRGAYLLACLSGL